jgi:hypothetical protein
MRSIPKEPTAGSARRGRRLRATAALGIGAIGAAAAIAGGAGPASASGAPVRVDTSSHNVDGCNVTQTVIYDPATNMSTHRVTFFNGQLFAACRVSVRGTVRGNIFGAPISVDLPVHRAMACAYLDPTCPHSVDITWTDFAAVNSQLAQILTPTSIDEYDHAGYDDNNPSAPWRLAPRK